jgi:hypothetical protein
MQEEFDMVEKLKEYFRNTSDEQIQKDWEKSAHLDDVESPTIAEFLNHLEEQQKTKTYIDPPSGWKYGFPKEVSKEEFLNTQDWGEWCIKNGYPRKEVVALGDAFFVRVLQG